MTSLVATSNDETVAANTALQRAHSDSVPLTPTPIVPPVAPVLAKKPPFPSASKWGRLVSSSLAGTASANTQATDNSKAPTTESLASPAAVATAESKATPDGGTGASTTAVGVAAGGTVKQSRWGRLKTTASDPPRPPSLKSPTPTKAPLSKAVSEVATTAATDMQKTLLKDVASGAGVTVHVTKPEAKQQPETVSLGDLRSELHAVTEQMQRVEVRLDVMFRMFSTFISGSGLKAAGTASDDGTGVEVVDLTGTVVRRSPDPRSRGNSVDMTRGFGSVFSSRLNSCASEDDLIVSVNDVPSNHTTSTDVTATFSPPQPTKPLASASPAPAKPPTLVRVLPLPAGGGNQSAMVNPGFVASPEAPQPDDDSIDPSVHRASNTSTCTSGAPAVTVDAERPLESDAQRTTSIPQTTTIATSSAVCKQAPLNATPTSGLTTFGSSTSALITLRLPPKTR